jgi:hypothetical protein
MLVKENLVGEKNWDRVPANFGQVKPANFGHLKPA